MVGLSGKVALVTGASRGVGNGVAFSLGVGYRWYGCCVASIVTILSGCALPPPPGDSPFDCSGIPGVRGERIALEPVASGLGNPTDIQAPPGDHGRLMVAALDGRIHVISLPGDTVAATPYFDLVDTPGGNNYGIPADNPWTAAADPQDQILDELWAIGPRNPWGVSFDPRNGDLYIGAVGGEPTAHSHEEVTYVAADATTGLTPAGMNFEWSIMEGFKVNYPDEVDSFGPGVRVGPIYDYERGNNTFPDGASVTGGVVYWGCALPDLRGTYFFGDWTAHWIASMRVDADGALTAPPKNRTAELNRGSNAINRPLAFGIDSRGEIYVSMMAGSVYRIVPRRR